MTSSSNIDPLEPNEELIGEWLNENDENIVDGLVDELDATVE